MKEFLNTLMIGDWVKYIGKGDGYYQRIGPSLLKDFYYQDNEEVSEVTIKPVLLSREMIERNGWKLVSAQGNWEEIYEKRVQEGKDNNTYEVVIYMEKPYDGKVVQVWIFKDFPQVAKNYKEYVASINHRSSHENIYVHTFQNLLNLAGLKETSEEFNIM